VKRTINNDCFYYLVITAFFIIWPLLGILLYLLLAKQIKNKTFAFVFIYGYIGYTLLLQNRSHDSYRYFENFKDFLYHPELIPVIISNFRKGVYDVFASIAFKLAAYTKNIHVFFAIVGAVFGYFVSVSYNVIKHTCHNKCPEIFYASILLIMFFTLPPILINGVRFGPAISVAFAGFLEYEVENKKRGLIFMLLSPLFHTSMFLFLIIYAFYKIFKFRKLTIWVWIFIFSSILSLFISSTSLANSLGGLIGQQSHFMAYLDSRYVSDMTEVLATRSRIHIILDSLCSIFMICYLLLSIHNTRDVIGTKVLSFFLIYMSIVNIIGIIPVLSRYQVLGRLLFLFLLLLDNRKENHLWPILLMFTLISFFSKIYDANYYFSDLIDFSIMPNII
jgi:hypothetical protein